MKRIFLTAIPVAAMAALMLNTAGDPLPLGAPIPSADVKMKDISGRSVSLKDAKTSKGLLVMFSCNTCPYVIKNQARTNEVCQIAKDKGLGVAILNPNEAKRGADDSFSEMQSYAKDQDYKWLYLEDKNHVIADAFGANRTPECFLFDGEGKLVYHGAIDDNPSDASSVNRKHLALAIEELNAGKDISVKQSKSVGCTIKRL